MKVIFTASYCKNLHIYSVRLRASNPLGSTFFSRRVYGVSLNQSSNLLAAASAAANFSPKPRRRRAMGARARRISAHGEYIWPSPPETQSYQYQSAPHVWTAPRKNSVSKKVPSSTPRHED
jgi:hypothetical protein